MEISFSSVKLQKVFSEEKKLIRTYGAKTALAIMMRIALLQGAPNLSLVPIVKPPRCHQLSGQRKGQFAVDLDHPKRLVFCPAHDPVPKLDDGGIDKEKVTEIMIIEVVDYH